MPVDALLDHARRPPRAALREVRRVLKEQSELLDRLAVERAHAHRPNWRPLLEAAHHLRTLVRSLPK